MPPAMTDLPVRDALPALKEALADSRRAVLVAPPGAGKTTIVPPALLDAPWLAGKRIVMLEPRRVAARAAARRMAALIGEKVGATVGYAMRMDTRQSAQTRILVVTEGVMARMMIDDPELDGVGAIIFDEHHERSLDGDFALALALDIAGALRDDLRLLVMSATLDGARVAALLGGAPVIESAGRSFPVDIRHRPRDPDQRIEDAMAAAIRETVRTESGSVLAFLPGRGEIERTIARLEGRLPDDADVMPLHGALDGAGQDAAIAPAPPGRRKVVLATAIAETSITIDGVRTVIDSGLARLPFFEPATGLTRLHTVRVSQASAAQRAGRAGRTGPGIAIRLWHAGQTGSLPAFTAPEIEQADLSSLLLDCAAFGVGDPRQLAFPDAPPEPALAEARSLLAALGAFDASGSLTETGRAMRKLALPVRLAAMVLGGAANDPDAARRAAELAMLLTERGLGGDAADLETRWERLRSGRGRREDQARRTAARLAADACQARSDRNGESGAEPSLAALLAIAYPDRIAMQRGGHGRFLLANGRGGRLDPAEPLAAASLLVVAELQGSGADSRIVSAAPIDAAELPLIAGERLETAEEARFDEASGALKLRRVERLGALTLSSKPLPAPKGPQAAGLLLDAIRAAGTRVLPWGREARAMRARLAWLHGALGDPWPAVDDAALTAALDSWLAPFLNGIDRLSALSDGTLREALLSRVPWDLRRDVDRLAPSHFQAPSGSRIPLRYEADGPVLAIRVQELFGLTQHPHIGDGTTALTLELLSPAHRPIQTTRDLPGFWAGSWADVRAEMRGRYPKHEWPADPANAAATNRAKPRRR